MNEGPIRGPSDPAHALATARAVGRAMGIHVEGESLTLAHLLTDAPGVEARVTPIEAMWDEALDHRKANRLDDYAVALASLASRLAASGQVRRATSCVVVAERIANELEEPALVVPILSARAYLMFWNHDYAGASRLYRRALRGMGSWPDHAGTARILLALGDSAYFENDMDAAERSWREAFSLFADDLAAQAETLERVAGLLFRRGDIQGGVEHAEAAMMLWEASGVWKQADRTTPVIES
jgi:tetratricopeptide (TPR) repeat protein